MKTRIIMPRPGRCGWTHSTKLRPLPPGLPDRTPVFIVAEDHAIVRAKDAHGAEWPLSRVQIDGGVYCLTPAGGWAHESTPTARAIIRRELQQHLASPRPDGSAGHRWDQKTSHLLWILQRNGENVSEFNDILQDRTENDLALRAE
jgi:hypothetical protein